MQKCDMYDCKVCGGDVTEATMHHQVCDQCYVELWLEHANRELADKFRAAGYDGGVRVSVTIKSRRGGDRHVD